MKSVASPPGPPGLLASAVAATQNLGPALGRIYQRLPGTQCARQGQCCGLLPPLAPLEMLVWLGGLSRLSPEDRASQVALLVEHFLTNAAQRRACPWSRPGACAIYGQRFLGCRVYGLWSPEAYEERRQAAQDAQVGAAAAWAGLGVSLPPEVLAPGPGYCQQVCVSLSGEKSPSLDDLLRDCEDQLSRLTADLPSRDLLTSCGGDLAYLLAGLALGRQSCLAAKVELTKALLAGQDQAASRLLQAHLAMARVWAISWKESSA